MKRLRKARCSPKVFCKFKGTTRCDVLVTVQFINDHIKQGLSLIQVPVPLLNFQIINFLSYCYQIHVIRYCEKSVRTEKFLWSIKNSTEVLDKIKCRGFHASSLSTYDFLTLYTFFPII